MSPALRFPGMATIVVLLSAILQIASASHLLGSSQLLSSRDATCPDGGVCLSVDDNICCPGGDPGYQGCMFSTGVCCGNGFWCYEGQFCSTTDPSANSDGDVNCCSDAACKNVVSGGLFVIQYAEQPGYTSGTGSSSATATGAAQTGVSSGISSVSNVVPTTGVSSTAAGSTPTPTTQATTSTSATSASPAATKSSAGERGAKVDPERLYLPVLAIGVAGLGLWQ